MKRLSSLLTVLFFLLACFFGYKYYNAEVLLAAKGPTVDKTKCTTCMEYNNVDTAPKLDMNLIKTMTHDYQVSQPTTNTRSVWLSLKTLKNFIYQIESKTCACDSALGVRVYNAKYPADVSWLGIFNTELGGLRTSIMSNPGITSNVYQSINTVVLVPTHRINNKNYDFDPNDPTTTCSLPKGTSGYSSKYFDEKGINYSYFSSNRAGISVVALMAQNHGDACPPPITGTSCPDQGASFDY